MVVSGQAIFTLRPGKTQRNCTPRHVHFEVMTAIYLLIEPKTSDKTERTLDLTFCSNFLIYFSLWNSATLKARGFICTIDYLDIVGFYCYSIDDLCCCNNELFSDCLFVSWRRLAAINNCSLRLDLNAAWCVIRKVLYKLPIMLIRAPKYSYIHLSLSIISCIFLTSFIDHMLQDARSLPVMIIRNH